MAPVRLHQFGAVHEQAVLQLAACERRGQPALIETHSDETNLLTAQEYTLMGFEFERSAGFV
jgi:hypothetical protein